MSTQSQQQVMCVLRSVSLPASEQKCVTALKNIEIKADRVQVTLSLGYPLTAFMQSALTAELQAGLGSALLVDLVIEVKVASHAVQPGVKGIAGIKNVISVASGKGGVGKSTTAVNLALALSRAGAAVGLLDADISGPNQPLMLGIQQKPKLSDNKKFIPPERYGIQSMSMGYLVGKETPLVWRGPMVSSALNQLFQDTQWKQLDYLIVDMPPGTGDVQLTLAKKIPVSGVVIVTTPQDVAVSDARRALEMFKKMDVPILGVVENMSAHICSQCGHEEALFGTAGGAQLAADCAVPLLGQLPLALAIRQASDQGEPIVVSQADSTWASAYSTFALKVAAELSTRPKGYSHLFTNIAVEAD